MNPEDAEKINFLLKGFEDLRIENKALKLSLHPRDSFWFVIFGFRDGLVSDSVRDCVGSRVRFEIVLSVTRPTGIQEFYEKSRGYVAGPTGVQEFYEKSQD
ncbi:hypothetical protein BDEG_20080 [Batrachochytrium dendrobatidis JEL423]|uniref:Uncharacterized protein n=1 Tax=Batrachochytrium dendrobatidis (strain JEL423) TaxID=403673 RepID=A0A177W6Z0_BATDL|nr:hypothetical protein BDEG_20080 [Batrachochytrium dendrobatidis JEL423]